jgi:hypothetical protein
MLATSLPPSGFAMVIAGKQMIVSLLSGALAIAMAPVADAGYLWKFRPVFVFAGPEGDASFAEQQRLFKAHHSDLTERSVVIVWVRGDSVTSELGPAPGLNASQLRSRYGASSSGFRVVLAGKDGGTKLTQTVPLHVDRLFGTIDAMPMRRSEMAKEKR